MKLVHSGYGSFDVVETAKKWSWPAFATGVAAAAATGGLGLLGLTMAGVDAKHEKHLMGLGAGIPALGAGFIAYLLRVYMDKPCPAETGAAAMEKELPFMGYGVAGATPVVGGDGWVMGVRIILSGLGYDVGDTSNDYTDDLFHAAVTQFQADHGLSTTGWVDGDTSLTLSEISGEPVATIMAQGIGIVPSGEIKPKTNWAMVTAFGVGTIGLGSVIMAVATKKSKRGRK